MERQRDRLGLAGTVRHAHQDLDDDRREDGPDWIVDDGLPLEKGSRPPLQAGVAQEREDHGRAGHDQDGAEHPRGSPQHSAYKMSGQGTQEEVDRQCEGSEPENALASGPEFAEVEGETTLEHYDGHRQPNQRTQAFPEVTCRVHQAEHGAD